jgi:hypothetical protein
MCIFKENVLRYVNTEEVSAGNLENKESGEKTVKNGE